MSSFEWMELETLTGDTDTLRDQLVEARSRKVIARIRTLEEEIARSEERRTKLLAHLTTNMISGAGSRAQPRSHQPVPSVEEPAQEPRGDERPAAAFADPAEQASRREVTVADGDAERPKATVESLTEDIAASRVRLAVAKMRKDLDLVRPLEQRIATGEVQRKRLLANATLEAALAQNGHRPETVDHPTDQEAPAVAEDKALPMTELPTESDHSMVNVTRGMSSSDVLQRHGAEAAQSHLVSPPNQITTNLNGDPEPDGCDRALASAQEPPPGEVGREPHPSTTEGHLVANDADASLPNNAPIEEPSQTKVGDERHLSERKDQNGASDASSPTVDLKLDDTEGEITMWDQGELERTKKEVESQRDEMLERHCKELKAMLSDQAEELRQLDDDRNELEALEKAIGAASRKFKVTSSPMFSHRESESAAD